MLHYLHYIVEETHVEHAVGLVENKVLNFAQVDASELQVGDETSGSGYHHVGTAFKAVLLAGKFLAVGTAVDGHA